MIAGTVIAATNNYTCHMAAIHVCIVYTALQSWLSMHAFYSGIQLLNTLQKLSSRTMRDSKIAQDE